MKHDNENEEALTGGNVTRVYRSGNTVRRELKKDSKRIHRLLQHLESKGLNFVPKFLGIDENNREILTFIKGEAGNYPLKQYMWSNDSLVEIANMLRLYHDATQDFSIEENWQPLDHTPLSTEVLCHNDFAIYNIIFHHEKPVGIIDFDLAAPGPRLWDIAYTLYTCVPLSRVLHTETGEAVYYNSVRDAELRKRRIELFFETYNLKGIESGFLEMVLLRIQGLCKTMQRKADEGELAFQKMIDEGHYEHYQKDLQFLREYGKDWM
ncbi:phosphotransferase [Bacillus lacus]|uniref:Phosphotransferase n=1 Tax=Metabacillus lacus TaxID=1983721 RepID=A0A7X2J229_9BACI|nr:phosphotransferase [Metabacillus lacus]